MKRILVAIACLALASPAWAEKPRRVPVQNSPLAPVVTTISGSPLTIAIGDDTSMQVTNTNVPGTGQFYPPDCAPGQTADSGVFASVGATVYGPDFNNHPCGSASNSYTPWTPVSLSAVTGTGTSGDPFTVVVVADAAAAQLRVTETITYVNGNPGAAISLQFSNAPPPGVSSPGGGATFNAFLAGDLFLADSDSGFGAQVGTQYGGRGASACAPLNYTILLGGTTPPTNWSATGYGTVWDEVSAAGLNDAVDSSICQDNGAAIEWAGLNVGGTPVVIGTGVSFSGTATPVGAAVPALSGKALAALVLLLAGVGNVLAKRTSLGA
ncbi:MAG TPA: hypothetical protein VN032_10005 [Thermoanaerobaculia bacterium]|jgi:hypothetical protein|nr:hypothetical protein [Thermoanaerobaculia bacterium]